MMRQCIINGCGITTDVSRDHPRSEAAVLTVNLVHWSALEKVLRCVKYGDEDADQTLALSQAVITIAVAR
jgi:hypothetical protein